MGDVQPGEVEAAEDVEDFRNGDAARRRWRRRDDAIALVVDAERFALFGLVGLEIGGGPVATAATRCIDEKFRRLAFVEAVMALRRKSLQGFRQMGFFRVQPAEGTLPPGRYTAAEAGYRARTSLRSSMVPRKRASGWKPSVAMRIAGASDADSSNLP